MMIGEPKTGEYDFVRKFGGGFPKKVWLELKYDGCEGG